MFLKTPSVSRLKTFLVFIVLVSSIMVAKTSQAAIPLKQLKQELKKFQAKEDYQGIAKTWEKMLTEGYKSYDRFKKLADLYLFLKEEKKGIDTMRRLAEWDQSMKAWETYSDILLWKKQRNAGIKALEAALTKAPDNQRLKLKLAGVYEYHKRYPQALEIWQNIYKNDQSLIRGEEFARFYLRNGKVAEAYQLLNQMEKHHGIFSSKKLNLLKLQVSIWNGKIPTAGKTLQRLKISDLPKENLDFYYTIAKAVGNRKLAFEILDLLEKQGKDFWQKRYLLLKEEGEPQKLRALVEKRIALKGETVPLLKLLFETYRSERDEKMVVKTIEKITRQDYRNRQWVNYLMQSYYYNQSYQRGIKLFRHIAEKHKDANLIRISLAKLYLKIGKFKQMAEILNQIKDAKWNKEINAIELQSAIARDQRQLIYSYSQKRLKYLRNVSPELLYLEALKKKQLANKKTQRYQSESRKVGYKKKLSELFQEEKNKNPDLILREDSYLLLLENLIGLTNELDKKKENYIWGEEAYRTVKSRYNNFPTLERAGKLVKLGEVYASSKEHEEDLKKLIEKLAGIPYFYKYIQLLDRTDRKDEARENLKLLLLKDLSITDKKTILLELDEILTFKQAKQLIQEIQKEDPDFVLAKTVLIKIALNEGNTEEAGKILLAYLNSDVAYEGSPLEAYENIFSIENLIWNQEDRVKSYQIYSNLINQFEESDILTPRHSAIVYSLKAMTLTRMGKYSDALENLKLAKKKQPDLESIPLNQLQIFIFQKRWLDTIFFIEKYQFEEINPIEFGLLRYEVLNKLGKKAKARETLNQLAKKFPQNEIVIQEKIYFHNSRREDKETLNWFDKEAKLFTPSADLWKLHREVRADNSNMVSLGLTGIETTKDGESETIRYIEEEKLRYLINHKQRILASSRQIQGEEKQNDKESANKIYFSLGYQHILSEPEKAEIHLLQGKKTGLKLNYHNTYEDLFTADLKAFYNNPDISSLGIIIADSYNTGYQGTANWNNLDWNQYYSISYLNREHQFKENGDDLKIKEEEKRLSASQSFNITPSDSLYLSLVQHSNYMSGDKSGLYTEEYLAEYAVGYVKNWTQNLTSELTVLGLNTINDPWTGKEDKVEKTGSGGAINLNYQTGKIKLEARFSLLNEDSKAEETKTLEAGVKMAYYF